MFSLVVINPSTFSPVAGESVEVFKGYELFYEHNSNATFNLPRGRYFTNVPIVKKEDVIIKQLKLPKRERDLKQPKINEISIELKRNKNLASIAKIQKKIIIDKSLWLGLKSYEKLFLIFHELGHYRYSTELFCDMYAANQMLKLGYNPKQVALSSNGILSDKNYERKDKLITKLEKL